MNLKLDGFCAPLILLVWYINRAFVKFDSTAWKSRMGEVESMIFDGLLDVSARRAPFSIHNPLAEGRTLCDRFTAPRPRLLVSFRDDLARVSANDGT